MASKVREFINRFVGGKDEESPSTGRKHFDPDCINDGFDTEESAVKTIEDLFADGRQRMYPYLRQWVINTLMYRGKHFMLFQDDEAYEREDGTCGIQPDPDEDGYNKKVLFTANLLLGHCQSWIAKQTHHDPQVEVYPQSDDERERTIADTNNDLIDWKRNEQGFSGKFLELTRLTAIHGNAFLKAEFDPEAGALVNPAGRLKPGDRELLSDPEVIKAHGLEGYEDQIAKTKASFDELEREGNVVSRVVPAYEITYLDDVRNIDEAPRIMHSRVVTMQWLKERYWNSPNIDKVKSGLDAEGHRICFAQRLDDSAGGGSYDDSDSDSEVSRNDANEQVLLHEYWAKPTRKRPKGMLVVVAGGQMLWPHKIEEAENPYYHGELPFSHFKQVDDGVSLLATSLLEQGISAQLQINIGGSQIANHRDMSTNPILLEEKGAIIDFDNLMGLPGEKWEIKKGQIDKVKYLEPPKLPATAQVFLQDCRQFLEDIFSNYQPDRGESKAGDSGAKVRTLQLASEAKHRPYAVDAAEQLTRHWLQMLCLMAQYTEEEKLAHVTGRQKERNYFRWSRDTMIGQNVMSQEAQFNSREDCVRAMIYNLKYRLDVQTRVIPGKGSQTTREDVSFLLETGTLQPQNPEHATIILDMLDYAYDSPQITQERRQQTAQAALENDEFLATNAPLPIPGIYELHIAHLNTHKRLTNTEEFRSLPDPVQAAFLGHIEQHEEALIREPLRMEYLKQRVLMDMTQQLGPLMSMMGPPPDEKGQAPEKKRRQQMGESQPAGPGQPSQPINGG